MIEGICWVSGGFFGKECVARRIKWGRFALLQGSMLSSGSRMWRTWRVEEWVVLLDADTRGAWDVVS